MKFNKIFEIGDIDISKTKFNVNFFIDSLEDDQFIIDLMDNLPIEQPNWINIIIGGWNCEYRGYFTYYQKCLSYTNIYVMEITFHIVERFYSRTTQPNGIQFETDELCDTCLMLMKLFPEARSEVKIQNNTKIYL